MLGTVGRCAWCWCAHGIETVVLGTAASWYSNLTFRGCEMIYLVPSRKIGLDQRYYCRNSHASLNINAYRDKPIISEVSNDSNARRWESAVPKASLAGVCSTVGCFLMAQQWGDERHGGCVLWCFCLITLTWTCSPGRLLAAWHARGICFL